MTTYNRNTLIVGTVVALLVGGVLSFWASGYLDGLEKTQEKMGTEGTPYAPVAPVPSPFDEYGLKGVQNGFLSNAAAGVAGSLVVLVLLLGVGYALKRRRPVAGSGGAAAR